MGLVSVDNWIAVAVGALFGGTLAKAMYFPSVKQQAREQIHYMNERRRRADRQALVREEVKRRGY